MEIYCAVCNEVKNHRPKGVPVVKLVCNTCDHINLPVALIKSDTDRHFGKRVIFIEWGEDGRFKEKFEEPAVGRSCMIDPQYEQSFTWMTTEIIQILESTDINSLTTYRFKTQNSEYTLYIHHDENI
jgi:hypothetical protein